MKINRNANQLSSKLHGELVQNVRPRFCKGSPQTRNLLECMPITLMRQNVIVIMRCVSVTQCSYALQQIRQRSCNAAVRFVFQRGNDINESFFPNLRDSPRQVRCERSLPADNSASTMNSFSAAAAAACPLQTCDHITARRYRRKRLYSRQHRRRDGSGSVGMLIRRVVRITRATA